MRAKASRGPIKLLPSKHHNVAVAEQYTGMMDERFCTFHFHVPLPLRERDMEFPHCSRCAAEFYLKYGTSHQSQTRRPELELGVEVAESSTRAGPSHGVLHATDKAKSAEFLQMLSHLANLHSNCFLDAEEFRVAKKRILHM